MYCSKVEPDSWKLQRHINRHHCRSSASADLSPGKAYSSSEATSEEDEYLDGENVSASCASGVEGMERADGLMRKHGNTNSSNFSEDSSPRKLCECTLKCYSIVTNADAEYFFPRDARVEWRIAAAEFGECMTQFICRCLQANYAVMQDADDVA